MYEQQRAELSCTFSSLDIKQKNAIGLDEVTAHLDRAQKEFEACDDLKELKHQIQLFTDSVIVDNEGVEINTILKTPPGLTGDVLDTTGSANETRTRVSALRGRCPRPLDDSATYGCGTRTRT